MLEGATSGGGKVRSLTEEGRIEGISIIKTGTSLSMRKSRPRPSEGKRGRDQVGGPVEGDY